MENNILNAIFNDRSAFDRLNGFLTDEDFSDAGKIVFEGIKEYYEIDPDALRVNEELFLSKIERNNPKHFDLFKGMIMGFREESSIPNIINEATQLKKHKIRLELSSALLGSDDRKIQQLIDQLSGAKEVESTSESREIITGASVEEIIKSYSRENLIQLYPKSLNDRVDGGVLRGHNILLYARPEVGKSLFAINMAAGFAVQGLRVLYIINEDPLVSIVVRMVSRLSGCNRYEIIDDPQSANAKANEKGYKNITFVSLAPGTLWEIESLIKEYKPDCVVIDQIRNIKIKGTESGLVHQLESSASAVRALGKKYNLVIVSVTQAGDSASNKLVLDMSDVDSSKTGLPAQIDLMLGIGMNDQFRSNNQRMISICKNKITADHSFFPVVVDESLSKVTSV